MAACLSVLGWGRWTVSRNETRCDISDQELFPPLTQNPNSSLVPLALPSPALLIALTQTAAGCGCTDM